MVGFLESIFIYNHCKGQDSLQLEGKMRSTTDASNQILAIISPPESQEINPSLNAVQKTLLSSWDDGFKTVNNVARATADTVIVDLNKLQAALKPSV